MNADVVVPDPVSATLALFINVMEPLMPPFIVIAIFCRLSPLNWGQTTLPLSSVGPLSVEQVTVMIVAEAVPERGKGGEHEDKLRDRAHNGFPPIVYKYASTKGTSTKCTWPEYASRRKPINWEKIKYNFGRIERFWVGYLASPRGFEPLLSP
jgi:hypothetical protein